ncbi:GreA/GreB family elongation factor [Saccharopolyspora hordei]|uniref:Transcription elongation GreA/GreB family factor n=1 Tax=Saccharopolyspora hordei TaxID=1838 RepID=A0A853ATK8_9PSEU|nr:GreA/GreB family elongation factor [Saccharopolyspora hordei]NYI85989.1 transcription elongation GreA/GreB family factor [Saccharopolyspora hordei]
MAGADPDTRARLAEEIRSLRARRKRLVDEMVQSSGPGDSADASQELQGGDEVAAIDDRIAALEDLMAGIDVQGLAPGTEVVVREADGSEQTYKLVAIPEQTRAGEEDITVTSDSPLGMALSRGKPGETVHYPTPDGEAAVEVLEVRRPS